jgi:hypothetical protein
MLAAYQAAKLRPVKPFNLTQNNCPWARGISHKKGAKVTKNAFMTFVPSCD